MKSRNDDSVRKFVMMTVPEQVAMMTVYEQDVRMTAYEKA